MHASERHADDGPVLAALNDPNVEVVAELIGGTTTALQIVLQSLAAGKHVVTANKATARGAWA